MNGDIKVVTFDARGTLLKVRFPVGETYAAVARRHGADLSTAAIEAAFFTVFPSMPPLAFPPMSDRVRCLAGAPIVGTFRNPLASGVN